MGCCKSSPTWDNTAPYVPEIRKGRVIKVYDGDTITIATRLSYWGPVYRFSVRLRVIDAKEIHSKNPEEKESAIKARDRLRSLTLDKIVLIKNRSQEKYGRVLATVILPDGRDASTVLLEEGYVNVYK